MENFSSFSFYNGNLDFFVRSVGHFAMLPRERGRVKTVDFGEIFWCIEGSGFFCDDKGNRNILSPGWVWYYPPGSTHVYGNRGKKFNYRWLTLDGPGAGSLFSGLGIAPGLHYAGNCPEECFERIHLNTNDPGRMPDMLSDAFFILTRIVAGNRRENSSSSLAAKARELIDMNFRDFRLNVESIAEMLNCHRVSVARDFKMSYGIAISSYLHTKRCREAFKLICDTAIPLVDIPELCGFNSIHYMSRVIRNMTGQPPGMLRKHEKN